MGDDARPSAILALGRRSVPPPRHGWIAYVDMDAFYVSCEIRDRPELADRPVIVGREPTGPATRGVVLSASYPARRSGVHSAMPVLLAARRCPEAIWIAPDFPKYTRISGEIRDYLDRWSGRVVPLSIDEAALEIDRPNPESVAAWARELTSGLAAELRMPASVGASRSAVVAKIACDAAKPGGIRVVAPEETEAFLAPKPVGAIPGIGPKTAERLAGVGVGVIGELARASPESLRAILGSATESFQRLARGEPGPELSELPEPHGPRQRSVDRTLEHDLREPAEILAHLAEMAEELGRSLAEEGLRYQSVVVRLRWEEFTQAQHGQQLSAAQEGARPLAAMAVRLARELLEGERAGGDRAVRRISLSAAKLTRRRGRMEPLERFDGR